MRSPRSRLESLCRIGAFALLGWLLGGSLIRVPVHRVEHVNAADAAERLASITRATDAPAIHLTAPVAPERWVVDWLAALRRTGTTITWNGKPPVVAINANSIVDPEHGARVSIAAPNGAVVRLRDAASEIDSVRVADFGATIAAPTVVGGLKADVEGQRVSVAAPDSIPVRDVLVVGSAGWEAKFVATALEERGWPVVARFVVAPGVDVVERDSAPLDTARFAAVIAIDSTAESSRPALERFVHSGGGLILAGSAPRSRDLASLAAGTTAARTRPQLQAAATIRLGATGFYPITHLAPGALVLERRDGGIAIAARRVGAGRVLQLGYDDTWAWRMAGGPGSDAAHREWWSRVVSSVAFAPVSAAVPQAAESAPLAHLVDRLGAARAAPPQRGAGVDPRVIIALITILLLVEWSSRRLRGLR